MSKLEQLVSNFVGRKVLVIGDIVADQYLDGTITRVSREAPVFILRHDETRTFPGAASNAAANVASLGASVSLVGILGDDEVGRKLSETFLKLKIDDSGLVRDTGNRTTTKVRVLGGQPHASRQQVIRIDYECRKPSAEVETALIEKLRSGIAESDAVIVSDYGYGVISKKVFAEVQLIAKAKGIPVIVDSRFGLGALSGATSATPNQEEVEALLGRGFSHSDCESLRNKLELTSLLVTNGNKGMTLFESDREPLSLDVVGSSSAVDVTGAGDTVIATYALSLAAGASFADAATIANHAGGIVVMKKGTATVNREELINSIKTMPEPTAATSNG
ncbi:MAG TPA: PfkB family carbohydrate kinase [Pyrinomonadaceae bacterium]|nr:PfkB family carbohydrate kinase [Pyrinomonadaceae bacterium]